MLFSVAATTSFFSLGFIPNIAANLSVNDVLLVCESSFIVSGVLLVISSSLPIGENSIVFVPCSSTFGIGVDSVVFLLLVASCVDHIHSNISSRYPRVC